jgi:hypothetical protein
VNTLTRAGWDRNVIKVGDGLTVDAWVARDGSKRGNARENITLGDGRKIFAGERARGADEEIFLDGRKHPADPDPTWYGHSVGTWEKDTLVVDTVGYNDLFWFGANGLPHTTRLHTVERFTRPDLKSLSWDITIDDPGAFAKPFTVQTRARLEPTWELMEYICQENNTNVGHIQGAANGGTANGGEFGR